MNINGGYSVQDYETLMANHLEGEIKPFVDSFIAALNAAADFLKTVQIICYEINLIIWI